ncbi:MAG TPA: hypothetical protein VGM34_00160 [Chlamydiales bacterium]|jgi:hypothetical protein
MIWWTALIPFALQAIAIGLDEGVFHIRRGLPKWERIGHPLDTLTVLGCMAYVLFVPFSNGTLLGFIGAAAFSTFFVTKDEFVHKAHCPASEQWLHAVLFTLHPLTLISAGFIWPVVQNVEVTPWIAEWLSEKEALRQFLLAQFAVMSLFCIYQVVFWNWIWKEKPVVKHDQ